MTKLFWVVSVAVLLLSYSLSEGSEWKYYVTDQSKCKHYYKEITSWQKGVKTVWDKIDVQASKELSCRTAMIDDGKRLHLPAEEYDDVSEKQLKLAFDCTSKKVSLLSVISYDETGKMLHYASSDSEGTKKALSVVPDTLAETLFDLVCK